MSRNRKPGQIVGTNKMSRPRGYTVRSPFRTIWFSPTALAVIGLISLGWIYLVSVVLPLPWILKAIVLLASGVGVARFLKGPDHRPPGGGDGAGGGVPAPVVPAGPVRTGRETPD